MAKADILLRAGIQFNANDVDTRRIKAAITKALSTVSVDINRIRLSRAARTSLNTAIQNQAFRIDKARFGRSGLTQLKGQFREAPFRIDNAQFSRRAINQLNRQLKGTQFEIARAAPARGAARGTGVQDARTAAQATETFSQAVQRNRQTLQGQLRDLEAFAVGTTNAERSQRNFLQAISQGSTSLKGFGANIIKITQRFSAYLVSIKAVLLAQQAFSQSLQFIFDFDSALQNLRKVIPENAAELENLSDGLFSVANETAQAVTGVAQVTGDFVRQGLSVSEALERTRAALIGVNAANITLSDSTKLITVALRVFGDEIQNPIDALDILNITADNAATNQANITQALLRSGSAAKAVGISFGELNAIIAATVEQTQLSGNQIGSALKTIFARLATNTSGLREQANALGANIRPGESVITILTKLADIFPTLNRDQQAQLTVLASGKRRFTEFSAIIQQLVKDETGLSRVQELLNKQLDGAGNTAAKNEKELQKLSSRAQQVRNGFSQLVSELTSVGDEGGAAGGIGTLLDTFADLGKGLAAVVRDTKGLGTEFITVGSVLANLGKATFFAVAPLVIRQIIAGAKAFLGIGVNLNRVLQQQAGIQTTITKEVGQTVKADQKNLSILEQKIRARKQELVLAGKSARQLGQERRTGGFLGRFRERGRDDGPGLGGRIAAFTAILTASDEVAGQLNKLADQLRKSGDSVSADLISAGTEAGNAALQMGLIAGPAGAAAAGLTTLAASLTKLVVNLVNEERRREKASEALDTMRISSSVVTSENNRNALVSRDAREAVLLLTDAAVGAQKGLEGTISFSEAAVQGLRGLTASTSDLTDAFSESGRVLQQTTQGVRSALRELRIGEQVEEIVRGIQERLFVLQVEIEGGGQILPELQGAIRSQSKINALVSDQRDLFASSVDIAQQFTRALRARQDFETLRVSSQKEALVNNDAETKQLEKIVNLQNELDRSVESRVKSIEEVLKVSQADLRTLTRLRNNIDSVNKGRLTGAEFAFNLSSIQEDIVEATDLEAKAKEKINGIIENLKNISAERLKLENEIEEATRKRNKNLEDAEALSVAQTEQLVLANTLLFQDVQRRAESNKELEKSNKLELELALAAQSANSFEEQRAIALRASREEEEKQVRLINQRFNRQLETIEANRNILALAGRSTKELDAQLKTIRAINDARVEEIRERFQIQRQTDEARAALDDFNRKEQALRDIRLNQIDEVLRREQEATQRRISFIERIGETAAGRRALRPGGGATFAELGGRAGDIRQFGEVRAALLRQAEELGEAEIQAIQNRLAQLEVSGVETFQKLQDLEERRGNLAAQISSETFRISQGIGDPNRLRRLETEFERVEQAIDDVKRRGVDGFKLIEERQKGLNRALEIREERLAERRKAALDLVEEAADRANDAEKQLAAERNKVPALNQKIISAQKSLAQAEVQVEEATKALQSANQSLADANFKLALDIGLAEFRARQAAGGFGSVAEAIGSLRGAFQNAVAESRGSFEAILEARREVLQEEVSLVQNQLQALQGLAQRAFTADPEELARINQAGAIAEDVQAGRLGAQDLLDLPQEIRQALTGFTDLFPELDRAITEAGLLAAGIDPSTVKTLEQQLVDLNVGIAETGQLQVQQAEEQVRVAQEQLQEARDAKDLAAQQLENAIAQKQAQLDVVAATAQSASIARAGFQGQVRTSLRILEANRRGARSTEKIDSTINELRAKTEEGINLAQDQTEKLGIQLGIIKENTTKLDALKVLQEAGNAAIGFVQKAVEVGSDIASRGFSAMVSALDSLQIRINRASDTSENFRGSLSHSELAGLYNAARREKAGMPSGARLMIANTSEVVLTRKQAKRAGLSPIPKANAQEGNAALDGNASQALSAAAEQLSRLNTQLQDITNRAVQPQNINVQLDSDRTIRVEGINNLESSLQQAVESRLQNTPSQAEVSAINQTITEVVERLKEGGLEDFQNV